MGFFRRVKAYPMKKWIEQFSCVSLGEVEWLVVETMSQKRWILAPWRSFSVTSGNFWRRKYLTTYLWQRSLKRSLGVMTRPKASRWVKARSMFASRMLSWFPLWYTSSSPCSIFGFLSLFLPAHSTFVLSSPFSLSMAIAPAKPTWRSGCFISSSEDESSHMCCRGLLRKTDLGLCCHMRRETLLVCTVNRSCTYWFENMVQVLKHTLKLGQWAWAASSLTPQVVEPVFAVINTNNSQVTLNPD